MEEFLQAMKEEVEETRAARILFKKGSKLAEQEYRVIYDHYRAKLGKSTKKGSDVKVTLPPSKENSSGNVSVDDNI